MRERIEAFEDILSDLELEIEDLRKKMNKTPDINMTLMEKHS